MLVNGTANTQFSGDYNVLVNGTLNDFGASGQNNTILAGRQCSFDDKVTGAVILADHETTLANNVNHSLTVGFSSGVTFRAGDVEFDSHLKVNANHSGILSGNVHIGGDLDVTGDSVFAGSVEIDDILVLQDGSQAASQTWVNHIGSRFKIDNSYPSDLSSYLDAAYGNSFGTNSTDEVLNTGQPVTGLLLVDTVANPDEAKLVFVTDSFTGVIDFTQFQYVT